MPVPVLVLEPLRLVQSASGQEEPKADLMLRRRRGAEAEEACLAVRHPQRAGEHQAELHGH